MGTEICSFSVLGIWISTSYHWGWDFLNATGNGMFDKDVKFRGCQTSWVSKFASVKLPGCQTPLVTFNIEPLMESSLNT